MFPCWRRLGEGNDIPMPPSNYEENGYKPAFHELPLEADLLGRSRTGKEQRSQEHDISHKMRHAEIVSDAKAAKLPPSTPMPLRLRGGLPRLAQSSLSLLATGRTAFIERRSPMPRLYVGADDSRCEECRDRP